MSLSTTRLQAFFMPAHSCHPFAWGVSTQ